MTTPTTTRDNAPLEHLLLRFGLVTLDQLSVALREQGELGTPFTDVLVRDGVLTDEELARVADREPAPPAARVVPTPPPVSVPEPAPAVASVFVVRGRLVNGDSVEIAALADADEAQRIARDAMRACARPDGDWPVVDGRYVRPESIVSIEVAERS